MARVGRLAGALLAETGAEFYLVGNTKVPCDFPAAGFEAPRVIDALTTPFVRLVARRAVELGAPYLVIGVEGTALAQLLADAFLIERTGSVSERLWRLVTGQSAEDDFDASVENDANAQAIAAGWLAEIPPPIWRIVRETVLRCS